MSGTDLAYQAGPSVSASAVPASLAAGVRTTLDVRVQIQGTDSPTVLRAYYAMSGTDVGYGPTRKAA
eukprot:3537537-Rhodomonas_salina.3